MIENVFDTYPGGKGGCYQQIINQMPPHTVYIEPFLGGGAVLRKKRPARLNIGIDNDPLVISAWTDGDTVRSDDNARYQFINANALDWLQSYPWSGGELVYLDPPYLLSTMRTPANLYAYPFTEEDHMRLLFLAREIKAAVIISGYPSLMYSRILTGWRSYSFEAQTRSGATATECLWMNYPEAVQLHDYQYLGENYRERERIRRKADRWVSGLQRLSILEQRAILARMAGAGLLDTSIHS